MGIIVELTRNTPTGSGHAIINSGMLGLEEPENFIKYFAGKWGNPQQKWLDVNTQSGLTLNGYAYGTQAPYRRLSAGDNRFTVGGYDNTGANANSLKEYSIFNAGAGNFNFGYMYPGSSYSRSFFSGNYNAGIELSKISANGSARYLEISPGYLMLKAISNDIYPYDLFYVQRNLFEVRGLTDRDGGVPRMRLEGSGFTVYGNEYGNANFYERLQLSDSYLASKLFHESYGAYQNLFMGHSSFAVRGCENNGAMRNLINAQFGGFTVGNVVTGNVFNVQNGAMSVGYFDNNTGPNTVFQVNPHVLNLYGTKGDITCAINPGGIDIHATDTRKFFRASQGSIENYGYDSKFSDTDSRYFYRHFCASSDSSVMQNNRGLILRQSNPGCNHAEALIVASDSARMEYSFWDENNSRSASVFAAYNGRFAVYHNDYNGNNDVTFAAHNGNIRGYYRDTTNGNYIQYLNVSQDVFELFNKDGYPYIPYLQILPKYFRLNEAFAVSDGNIWFWDKGGTDLSFGVLKHWEDGKMYTYSKNPLVFGLDAVANSAINHNQASFYKDGADLKLKVNIDGVMYGINLGTLQQL